MTKEKAKVVSAVLGTEFIRFLTVLVILQQDDLKKGMNSSYSSHCPRAIHPISLYRPGANRPILPGAK